MATSVHVNLVLQTEIFSSASQGPSSFTPLLVILLHSPVSCTSVKMSRMSIEMTIIAEHEVILQQHICRFLTKVLK